MTISIILFVLLASTALFAIFCLQKTQKAVSENTQSKNELANVSGKLAQFKTELSNAKEELVRKNRALEEARDVARKKLRKSALKSGSDEAIGGREENNETELERHQKTFAALEMQLRATQDDAERTKLSAKEAIEKEFEGKIKQLSDDNRKLSQEVSSLRNAQKSKRNAALGKLSVTVDALPEDIQEELARLLRKSEQHERLHAVAQGKFQLAQERFGELQKRYFAVCRELALAVGQDPTVSNGEARHTAEALIKASEESVLEPKAE